MTEILYIAGGRLTTPTSGNGVPLNGRDTEIFNFSNTEFDSFPFIGSGIDYRNQLLVEGAGLILNEYLVDSK